MAVYPKFISDTHTHTHTHTHTDYSNAISRKELLFLIIVRNSCKIDISFICNTRLYITENLTDRQSDKKTEKTHRQTMKEN